jgi:hypothetical protein
MASGLCYEAGSLSCKTVSNQCEPVQLKESTRRAMTPVNLSASIPSRIRRSSPENMSMMRVIAPTALCACMVANTKCPLSAVFVNLTNLGPSRNQWRRWPQKWPQLSPDEVRIAAMQWSKKYQ